MGLSCSRCGVSGCTQGSSGVCVQIQCFGVNVQRPWGQSTASVCDPSARGLGGGEGSWGRIGAPAAPARPTPDPTRPPPDGDPSCRPAVPRAEPPRRAGPDPRHPPGAAPSGSGRELRPRRPPPAASSPAGLRPSVRPVRSRPAAVAWGPPGRRDRAALPGIAPTAEPRRPRPPSRGTQRGAAPERRPKTPPRPRPGLEPRRAPPAPIAGAEPGPPPPPPTSGGAAGPRPRRGEGRSERPPVLGAGGELRWP